LGGPEYREDEMDNWSSVKEVLDFAIAQEEGAIEFYSGLAAEAERPEMRAVFKGFAQEERGHKQKLLGVKEGGALEPSEKQVVDLKIADYLVDITPTPDMTYQDVLVVAMKKEKAAFKLYMNLAAAAADETLRGLFTALAQEEAKHKLRFEVEYDDYLAEN
jgi:rubrerythrin